ncbi:unnamed protein product, partial [marine sediment metagenome]
RIPWNANAQDEWQQLRDMPVAGGSPNGGSVQAGMWVRSVP